MRDARLNGKLITASPHSPDVAICPACGGEVRKRRRSGKTTTYSYWFYFWRSPISQNGREEDE